MKKLIAILVVIILILSLLSGCAKSDEQINSLLNDIIEKKDTYGTDEWDVVAAEYEKSYKSPNFETCVMNKLNELISQEDYYTARRFYQTLKTLGYTDYSDISFDDVMSDVALRNMQMYLDNNDFLGCFLVVRNLGDEFYPQIKEFFQEQLKNELTLIMEGNSHTSLSDYLHDIYFYVISNDLQSAYFTVEELLPYEQMKAIAKTAGTPVITRPGMGGYYDAPENQYENRSHTTDPLDTGKTDGLGTFTTRVTHEYYGDLVISHSSSTWYGGESNGASNGLGYCGRGIYSGEGAGSLIKASQNGDVYFYEDTAKEDICFLVISEDEITYWIGNTFTIKY